MPTPTESVFADIRKVVQDYATLPDKFLAIDTETTGTRLHHGHKPFAVSACNQDGTTFFWRCPVNPSTREPQWKKKQLEEIEALILSYDYFVFHHAKFDIRALSKIKGLEKVNEHLTANRWSGVRDTLLYSHVMDSQEKHGLKALAVKYLDFPADDEEALQKAVVAARRSHKKSGYVPAVDHKGKGVVEWDYWLAGSELDTYSVKDAERTALLFAMYVNLVSEESATQDREQNSAWNVAREHLLQPDVYDMENVGIRLRKTTSLNKLQDLKVKSEYHDKKVVEIAAREGFKEFNSNSSVQLKKILYDKWNLPVPHYTKPSKATTPPSPSTDADALEILSYRSPQKKQKDFCNHLLESRSFSTSVKYLDEYCREAIPEGTHKDGTVIFGLHSNAKQVGTASTRFAMSDPNEQNVSTDEEIAMRECFGPRPDSYWLDGDFNNLEMRILAWDSGEKRLIKLFEEGGSYHLLIAEILFGPMKKWPGYNKDDWKKSPEYKQTKNGNFARGYGAGQTTTDKTYRLDGAYEKLKHEFKQWTAHNERMIKHAEEHGYVETLFGYKLTVDPRRAFTTALNYRIQGTAGCVMKYAMMGFNKLNTGGQTVLTVHDQLLTEWKKGTNINRSASLMQKAMEAPGKMIGIPLPVEINYVPVQWNKPQPLPKTA